MKSYLIFSDLDGTFLHHQNYSHGKNDLIIEKLKRNNHQIIFNSSKTYYEIKLILKKLKLTMMPFSCENGATLYFPKTKFKKIKKSQSFEDFWKINLNNKNSLQWYKILKGLKKDFYFKIISDLSIKELVKSTGLKNIKKMLNREASQLIIWKDKKQNFHEFTKMIKTNYQGTLNQGGRFIQISSPCNKRIATEEIYHIYHESFRDKYYRSLIALGDNKNDIEMLNFAKYACVIRNKYSTPIKLNSLKRNVYYSKNDAPLGWSESLLHLDKKLDGKIKL
ncbi:MAG: HAD-IIB family hydrolase [Alphaproteobacteria bacterium]